MRWTSAVAIYFLIWFTALFVVLPFEARTSEEVGATPLPGQADSAPHVFHPRLVVWRTTIVATASFALFWLNYRFGWIPASLLDVVGNG